MLKLVNFGVYLAGLLLCQGKWPLKMLIILAMFLQGFFGCLGRSVKVELNGERVPVNSFTDYVGLYLNSDDKNWEEPLPRSGANCLSSTDFLSVKERRWPEDIAWNPQGKSLVSICSIDGGDS